jgi:membrane-bound lytic murein transglycosylase A
MTRALLIPLLVAIAACRTTPNYDTPLPEGAPALLPLGPGERVPDFSAEWNHRDELMVALDHSLYWIGRKHAQQFFPTAGITHARAQASLERLRDLLSTSTSPADFQAALERDFQVYRSAGWDGRGGGVLFTGYCTPILAGSLTPDARFCYPLYKLPPDLIKDREGRVLGWETPFGRRDHYPSRAAIEASGMLKGTELVYLADPIDAYLAHVNGSAFIRLPDGTLYKVGYAGKNGREYVSLGRELVDAGKIAKGEANLASIRAWAASAAPDELHDFLNRNQSYVFFTPIDGNPHGSLDVEVSSGRSVATDKRLFPRAGLVWVEGKGDEIGLPRFFFDQAEALAGRTRIEGQMYYLFLREDSPAP